MNNILDYTEKIDYTWLDKEINDNDLKQFCGDAIKLGVKTVCVYPKFISKCRTYLKESGIGITTVADFPNGSTPAFIKKDDYDSIVSLNPDEIDVVTNWKTTLLTWKSKDLNYTENDIRTDLKYFAKLCKIKGIVSKVIIESGMLEKEQIEFLTNICIDEGVDFIKTSTGKVDIGARLKDLKQISDIIKKRKSNCLIKASGGIKTLEQIEEFSKYAHRLGIGYKTVNELAIKTKYFLIDK